MAGLSKKLLGDLRDTFLDCGPFYDGKAAQALFVDSRIRPWQHNLPEADSNARRVDAIISYLVNRRNRQGNSALYLLVQVMLDRTNVEDACHDRLADIGRRLEHELSQAAPVETAEPHMPSINQPVDPVRLHKLLTKHFGMEDLRTLCFSLGVDIDDLPAAGKSGKARELVEFMRRRGRTAELVAAAQKARSNVDW